MKFLGIDLGWTSGASGLCCLEWQEGGLHLQDLCRELPIADILTWVDRHLPAGESGIIAVDAPTLIPNQTGMRLPDRLAHKYFGRYHAGCYPANLGHAFASRTVGFGLSLTDRGFAHAPTLTAKQTGRFQIEVFPHPAMVHLFRLARILKYKKGTIAERRPELAKLRGYLLDRLPQLDPPLLLTDADLPTIPFKGTELKAVEDQLDSLVCAYVAAHWWYWGTAKNLVLGDGTTGYIIVPTPEPPNATCP
jgi:predicted RNase H-like nuclease